MLRTLFMTLAVAVLTLQHSPASAESSEPSRQDLATAAPAGEYPRIHDAAGILAPFVPRLSRMAEELHTDLGIDLRIVSSNDAQPTIEMQATALFEQRQIGRTAAVGGLLILLNPRLSSARIEVGYTLEGALTDHQMARVANDQLAPYASYGSAGMAVMDVVHYLRDHVLLAAALGRLTLPANLRTARAYLEYERFLSGGAGARTKLAALPADADLKRTLSAGARAPYAPSSRVEDSIEAYLRATADLVGDPTLELFTAGSQLMRRHYPYAPFEELRRLERVQMSKPLQVVVEGDRAVATSRKPAQGFVPILLQREAGTWRVDLVETWKNLFFDADGNYYLRNANTPYAFGLRQFGNGGQFDMAAVPLRGVPLSRWLAALDRSNDPVARLWRAEIWLRNAFVFPAALRDYEAARRAAPRDPWVLERYAERMYYLGFPELAIPAMEQIGRGLELSLADAYTDAGQPAGAHRWLEQALKENPYDLNALRRQQRLAAKSGRAAEESRLRGMIAQIERDPGKPGNPVWLFFHPEMPRFDPDTTLDVGGTRVFDHSKFGVTIQNTSARPVEIESVRLTSFGTAAASGLGDIKDYWQYPRGGRVLGPGEYRYFDKQWGFVVDTGHRHVRYLFRTCWHGVGSTVRQCRTQWVDTQPYIPNPE